MALTEETGYVLYQADALTDLAEVLRLQDRPQEAVTTGEEAERSRRLVSFPVNLSR